MNRFASGLPFRNFPGFDFREVDRDLELAERRRFFFPVDRAAEEFEARAVRRLRPPTREPFERARGTPIGNIPIHELTTFSLRH